MEVVSLGGEEGAEAGWKVEEVVGCQEAEVEMGERGMWHRAEEELVGRRRERYKILDI